MSILSYKGFEAASRGGHAHQQYSGEAWMPRKAKREVGARFAPQFILDHFDEKLKTLDVGKAIYSNIFEKFEEKPNVELYRRFPRDEHARILFVSLSEQWRQETLFESSISNVVMNENYQKIIGLGPRAVPWIIDDLRNSEDHWFWALRMITRENPVDEADRGNIPRMVAAWLKWAKNNGIE
ncbi:hypothetical protein ACN262_31495 [Burkholderia gladioli]|uniref:hypothetical protein n=1 Tax=Burkholderia gladioli TaxID=28095 RepID=UPI00163FB4C3|nr:hypothetical protein [Burkholderia gladioli]